MKFDYAIRILQKQINFYEWCIGNKMNVAKGMSIDIKELQAAIEILKKAGGE